MSNRRYPLLASAFPEFDQSTLPPIPLAWVDTSSRGKRFADACPNFSATPEALVGTGVRVVINWEDRCGCGDSYIVCLYDDSYDCVEEWGGDDWTQALEAVQRMQGRWGEILRLHIARVEAEEMAAAKVREEQAQAKALAAETLPPALREFPDYPAHALPPLPTDTLWHDESWGNDMCPCYHSADGFGVWLDYPNPEQRQFPESPRFTVFDYEALARNTSRGDSRSWDFETWEEVLAWINAARASLGPAIANGFGDSRDEAVQWIRAMHKANKHFHWEDSAHTIGTLDSNRQHVPTFTDAESIIVNACRLRLYDFKWPEDTCPCGVSLFLMLNETFADMTEGYRKRLAEFDLPVMSADDLWHELTAVMHGEKSAFITPERIARQGLDRARDYVKNFWDEWEEREQMRSNYLRLFPMLARGVA